MRVSWLVRGGGAHDITRQRDHGPVYGAQGGGGCTAALFGRRGGGGGGSKQGRAFEVDGHPRVAEDLLKGDVVTGANAKAAPDEVLALVGEAGPELELCHAELLVLFEGDVTAHHIVEEDA